MNSSIILPHNYGQPITISGIDPAAGDQFEFGVPVNAVIKIVSISFVLTTVAGGANRELSVAGFDGSNLIGIVAWPNGQAPSVGRSYTAVSGTSALPIAGDHIYQQVSLSTDLFLRFGDTFQTNVVTLDAADAITQVVLRYMQWIQE